ncbi:hypothetical protein L7F22_020127 [Adiantum nelumboides]|nr:hypothetical protein [Adiantum nelumboides]
MPPISHHQEQRGQHAELPSAPAGDMQFSKRDKIAIIGSGNWGSVAAKLVAENALIYPHYHDEVRMWVYEEILPSGQKLTDVINATHENVKYLPNIMLGFNVVADPDLHNAVKDATMLIFVTPHQFVDGICRRLQGKVRQDAKAISLIKGMEVVKREGPCMISSLITEVLGIECSVLMGANIANEIAQEKFSEATVGYRGEKKVADKWVQVFSKSYFQVTPVSLVDGLQMGNNTKVCFDCTFGVSICKKKERAFCFKQGNPVMQAAIMRIGLREMRVFSKLIFPSVKDSTFFESCGVADVITTCLGGRNRKVAEAFAEHDGKSRSFDELEADLLQGQKLQQGVSTAAELFEVLKARKWQDQFPLFTTVHKIATGELPPSAVVEYSEHAPRMVVEGAAQYY